MPWILVRLDWTCEGCMVCEGEKSSHTAHVTGGHRRFRNMDGGSVMDAQAATITVHYEMHAAHLSWWCIIYLWPCTAGWLHGTGQRHARYSAALNQGLTVAEEAARSQNRAQLDGMGAQEHNCEPRCTRHADSCKLLGHVHKLWSSLC